MAQWMLALTSEALDNVDKAARQMAFVEAGKPSELAGVADDTLALARALRFEIPDVSFTIEVDILGRHRITINFKGADVSVDAIETD